MKFSILKSTSLLALLLSLSAPQANADLLGLHVGAGVWSPDLSGQIGPFLSMDDLGFSGGDGNTLYVAFEHPIPLIPNIKVAKASISETSTIPVPGFPDQSLSTSIDLEYTDFTLYYEIVDIGIDLDLGLTARVLSKRQALEGIPAVDLDVVLPMAYAHTKIGLPLSGLYLGADANMISYDDNSIVDFSVMIGWETSVPLMPEFGVALGYRSFSVDAIDILVDLEQDGPFFNLTAHF